jgi:hypothetical protein
VTVELARCLIRGGLIEPSDLDDALLECARRGVSLAQALFEGFPDLGRLASREFERSRVATLETVRAAPELAASLPTGLCERLLAVPVFKDERTGVVHAACVDPLDRHMLAEFAFHLQAEVQLLRAGLPEILSAVEGLHAGGSFLLGVSRVLSQSTSERPKATATAEPRPEPASARVRAQPPSDAPIPLVRRSLAPRGAPSNPALTAQALMRAADSASKLAQAPRRDDRPSGSAQAAPKAGALQDALLAFESLDSADDVLEHLAAALGQVAERVLVFAVKSGTFEGRLGRGPGIDAAALRNLKIPRSAPSVLQTAEQAGRYLGPLSANEAHASFAPLLDAKAREVFALRVSVSDRPALVAVITGLGDAFTDTRRAAEIADAARRALERIVRNKKTRR